TPTPTTPAGSCKVAYATSDWSTGFTANITITNTGSTALNGWSLAFTFPTTGQKVGQGWSANFTQTGTAVTASNAPYNAALAPGASTTLGFNGTHTGTNPKPTAFTLNGSPCTLA
ncbi:endoglucanase, partial [Micromonospora sp. KC207]|uniref:cellulose binding domain-containing protein n=1 Tax=Micromonospora sp. KC207 TaxID=2530377 RepID=UPI0010D6C674